MTSDPNKTFEQGIAFVFDILFSKKQDDAESIGRRAICLAVALDYWKDISMAELAEKLGVSRQAVYQAVDKLSLEAAEIKAKQPNTVYSPLHVK